MKGLEVLRNVMALECLSFVHFLDWAMVVRLWVTPPTLGLSVKYFPFSDVRVCFLFLFVETL